MAKDNGNKSDKEDFNRKFPDKENGKNGTYDDTVTDTMKPPPRLPDRYDDPDESKR